MPKVFSARGMLHWPSHALSKEEFPTQATGQIQQTFLLAMAMSFRSRGMPSIIKILQNFQFVKLSPCQISK